MHPGSVNAEDDAYFIASTRFVCSFRAFFMLQSKSFHSSYPCCG